ncbi:riboflavin kinase / FMN adenylyltransferase [Acetitomaculum ruminis DSM 5522]|uniref:Riboflavin biosynthesis protein n=1 Tax=Acetitomaculum ruminis DSM 5522 TaxID=1120918 RepID=A0A1I0XRZ4_9FIRM|nr:bifunctional riboflavin kinase/FAD synthetase [Acetitomaculum ruminis]SFB03684.1 riboflavin kinase / FMN adenylyltransferase [Acetitomaculum ruminis DSM 5522]
MHYIRNNADYEIKEKTAICLGKFDGLHKGHRRLIRNISDRKKYGLKTVVYTFDTNPAFLINHEKEQLITTNYERKVLIEEMGIDYLYELPFTKEIMNLEPEYFIEKIVKELSIKYMTVGNDFRFGKGGRGDYALLAKLAKDLSFELDIIDKERYEDRDISSTYVRECIIAGDMEKSKELLGYPYTIVGEVVHGNQLGRTIDIPTANVVADDNKIFPPNGVYVSRVCIGDLVYGSVTNIGIKPTVTDKHIKGAESFIFDFSNDIYGKEIKIELLKYVRPEMKFKNIEELKGRMQADADYSKKYLLDNQLINIKQM